MKLDRNFFIGKQIICRTTEEKAELFDILEKFNFVFKYPREIDRYKVCYCCLVFSIGDMSNIFDVIMSPNSAYANYNFSDVIKNKFKIYEPKWKKVNWNY